MILVPQEINVLRREIYNRWFNLFPHFLSVILVETPAQVWHDIILLITFNIIMLFLVVMLHRLYANSILHDRTTK